MSPTAGDLRRAQLFSRLSDEELEGLRRAMTRHSYRRGEVVFYQEDPSGRLYFIEQGWVKISQQSITGDELTIDVFGPGSIFGELSIFTNEPRTATVTAVEPAVMGALSRESFYSLVQTKPRIALACLEMLARRLRSSDALLQDMTFLDVPARLAKRILELGEQAGQDVDGGRLIDLRITQEELATMVGTTRESINKTLALFQRQGVLGRRGGRILIKDPERLAARVY